MNHTKALFIVVEHNLNRQGGMDYTRLTQAVIALGNAVARDPEPDWYLGECSVFTLLDIIEGAYWHYYEGHSGMSSYGYAALCALGEVFEPGIGHGPDSSGSELAYRWLEEMAGEHYER